MIGFIETIISFFENAVHHVNQFFEYLEYFFQVVASATVFPQFLASALSLSGSGFSSLGALIWLTVGIGGGIIAFNIVRDLL